MKTGQPALTIIIITVAWIGAMAGNSFGGEVAHLMSTLLVGTAAALGVLVGLELDEKGILVFSASATLLLFLNHPEWGNASGFLYQITWIGGYLGACFSSLVSAVMVIAAVSILSRLLIFRLLAK